MAGGTLFQDIAAIASGMINSGNYDLAYDQLNQILQKNRERLGNISVPQLLQAVAEQQSGNAYDSVQMDPQTRAYQMQALSKLGDEVNTKGLTAEDQAAQQQALQQAGRFEAGQRGAAEARAAARGMGGAMSSQLAALQSQQSAINTANSNAVDIASQNRQRYMQALSQLGSQAGNVRGQDWQQASARAQAQNQINQFNTGMRWQAQQHNLALPQQNFQNQMGLTAAQNAAATAAGNARVQWARDQAGNTNQIGQGFGKFGDDAVSMAANAYGGGAMGGGEGGGGMDWKALASMFGGGK